MAQRRLGRESVRVGRVRDHRRVKTSGQERHRNTRSRVVDKLLNAERVVILAGQQIGRVAFLMGNPCGRIIRAFSAFSRCLDTGVARISGELATRLDLSGRVVSLKHDEIPD